MVNAFETFPHLLAPLKIGNTLFRNRMFSSPTGHTDITTDGQPSIEAVMYFERKAMGGCGAISTGEINVDPEIRDSGRWPRNIIGHKYNYRRLATAISRHGAVATAELQFEAGKSRLRLDAKSPHKNEPAWGPVDSEDGSVKAMTEER